MQVNGWTLFAWQQKNNPVNGQPFIYRQRCKKKLVQIVEEKHSGYFVEMWYLWTPHTYWYILNPKIALLELVKHQPIPREKNILMVSLTSRKLSKITGSRRMVSPSNTSGSLPSHMLKWVIFGHSIFWKFQCFTRWAPSNLVVIHGVK